LTTTEIKVTLCQPTFLKLNNYSVAIKSKYNSQYTGGIEGLIDGIKWKMKIGEKENGTKIKILKPL
jgi:hypothetical protein